jgi:hypothetical protein
MSLFIAFRFRGGYDLITHESDGSDRLVLPDQPAFHR